MGTHPVSPVASIVTVRFGREVIHHLDFIGIVLLGQGKGTDP